MAKDHKSNMEQEKNEAEVSYLKEENAYFSETIVALKQENSSLKETVSILQKEKLEYATQYNRLRNILNNIDSTLRTIPSKLLELTDSTTNVLQLVKIAGTIHMIENNNLPSCSLIQEKISLSENKAHVVKPHMVNGHILHIPTINLTRITDSYFTQKTTVEPQNTDEDFRARPSTSQSVNSENLENGEFAPNSNNNAESERRSLYTIPELPDAQTPEASATVLSGTFQEVNIYQISDKRLRQLISGRNEPTPGASGLQVDESFIGSDDYKKAFLPTVNLTRLKRKTSPSKSSAKAKRNKRNEQPKKRNNKQEPKSKAVVLQENETNGNLDNQQQLRRSSRIAKSPSN